MEIDIPAFEAPHWERRVISGAGSLVGNGVVKLRLKL